MVGSSMTGVISSLYSPHLSELLLAHSLEALPIVGTGTPSQLQPRAARWAAPVETVLMTPAKVPG